MGSPLARSAINTHLVNVVGSGLKCKPTIDYAFLGLSRDQAIEWEANTEREFGLWAGERHCDATKVNNFYEMQGLALTSWLLNGDGIALIDTEPTSPFMPYSLRVHLIESDRVTNPNTTAFSGLAGQVWYNTDNGNRVYNGVEIDDIGAIVAYHICNFYPNSFIPTVQPRKWIRVAAFDPITGLPNVIHCMYSERAEQYRGVPLLAPVIESLKQLTRYIDAELVASVINGFFTAFVTTDLPTGGMPLSATVPDEEKVDDAPSSYEMGPGTINRLLPGEKVDVADPKRPSQNFDAFVTSMARYIGTAVDVPYEVLMKTFNSNYSASRAAILEAWKGFRMRRTWLAKDFCEPIYTMWLAEAVARGRVSAPGFFDDPVIRKAWAAAEWNGPSQGQLDPLKEVMAAAQKVNYGFSNYERETTELGGGDWASNVESIIRDNGNLKKARDILTPAPPPTIADNSDEGSDDGKGGGND